MKFDQRISAATLSAAAALAFSPAAWSLGLGEASVESYLNQPLQARIDLISQASDDLTAITARLGSAEDYQLIGASLEAVPVPIRFTVEDIEGDAYLLATSSLPIDNPVLRLIVEVNWASGRMLREYTLFLDPPTVQESAPPPRIDQRETVASPPPAPVARPVEPPPSVAETPVEEPARQAPPIVTEQEYGPVQSGETLWEIASNWSLGSDVGINRAMIAIQRENPEAFVNGNINLLKRGAILRMPTLEEVENISSAAARREVIAHQERFAARRARATVAGGATPQLAEDRPPPPVDTEGAAPAAERVESEEPAVGEAPAETAGPAETEMPAAAADAATEAVPEEAVEVEEVAQDQLELVPPSADDLGESTEAAGSGAAAEGESGVQQLRESLARTEEELINQQQQNEYLEQRIRELESRLQQVEERAVADADLASMQDRLRDQRQAAAAGGSEPWYRGWVLWLLALLVVAGGLLGWLFSRRGGSSVAGAAPEPAEQLEDIRSEAEDVLRTLSEEPVAEAAEREPPQEPAEEPGPTVVQFRAAEEDAEVLDEESSDPEIQLDLARAYISMGDKEAARVILEEVISNGTEGQQAEAHRMLDLLSAP